MYYILRAHINYNCKFDHTIPLPADYLFENDLSLHNFAKWVPEKLFKDPKLREFNLVND